MHASIHSNIGIYSFFCCIYTSGTFKVAGSEVRFKVLTSQTGNTDNSHVMSSWNLSLDTCLRVCKVFEQGKV
jgi:hypothetical protein